MDIAIITYIPNKKRGHVSRKITTTELRENGFSETQNDFFKYLLLFIDQGAIIINVEHSPNFYNLLEYPKF